MLMYCWFDILNTLPDAAGKLVMDDTEDLTSEQTEKLLQFQVQYSLELSILLSYVAHCVIICICLLVVPQLQVVWVVAIMHR